MNLLDLRTCLEVRARALRSRLDVRRHPVSTGSEARRCTLTTRNRFDISASQWNTSPVHGKVGSAIGLKSLSALATLKVPAWSSCANGKLDIDLIKEVSVGVETASSGNGHIIISDVQLAPPGWATET